MEKQYYYEKPVLKESQGRWYVEYYRHEPPKRRERVRVYVPSRIRGISSIRAEAKKIFQDIKEKEQLKMAEIKALKSEKGHLIREMQYVFDLHYDTWKKKTQSDYTSIFKKFKSWARRVGVDRLPVRLFEYSYAQEYFDHLNCGSQHYNKHRAFLNKLFRTLIKRKKTGYNPFQDIEIKRVKPRKKRLLSQSEYESYLDYMRTNDFGLYIFISLMRVSLARPSELLALKIKDLDFNRQVIYIDKEISKTDEDRTPVIPDSFIGQLEYLKTYSEDLYVFGKNMMPGEKSTKYNTMRDRHAKMIENLRLRVHFTPYMNKHYGALGYKKAGLDLSDIQRQCGHTSIETTMIYFNSLEMDQHVYEAIRKAKI